MKRKAILILILLLIVSQAAFSEVKNVKKIDPIMAGVMSWYIPGLGQLYSGDYLKGTLIWFAENAILISAIISLAEIDIFFNKEVGLQLTINWKQKISTQNYLYTAGLFIGYFIFHIYNVIDAIYTAYYKNIEIEESRFSFGMDIKFVKDERNTYICLNRRF